jgi:hypothetical protein
MLRAGLAYSNEPYSTEGEIRGEENEGSDQGGVVKAPEGCYTKRNEGARIMMA